MKVMDKLASYDTLVLAKSKGYDLTDCVDYGVVPLHNWNKREYLKQEESWYYNVTLSQIQTWLRNIHGIHISIEVSYDDLKQFKGYEYLVYRNSDEKWANLMEYIKDDYPLFATYEDALEEGLVKALMMLPIPFTSNEGIIGEFIEVDSQTNFCIAKSSVSSHYLFNKSVI